MASIKEKVVVLNVFVSGFRKTSQHWSANPASSPPPAGEDLKARSNQLAVRLQVRKRLEGWNWSQAMGLNLALLSTPSTQKLGRAEKQVLSTGVERLYSRANTVLGGEAKLGASVDSFVSPNWQMSGFEAACWPKCLYSEICTVKKAAEKPLIWTYSVYNLPAQTQGIAM